MLVIIVPTRNLGADPLSRERRKIGVLAEVFHHKLAFPGLGVQYPSSYTGR